MGKAGLVPTGMFLGTIDSFHLPFPYLGNEHVTWSLCSLQMDFFLSFSYFNVLPRAPPMCICQVGAFSVQCGGSLIYFQFF